MRSDIAEVCALATIRAVHQRVAKQAGSFPTGSAVANREVDLILKQTESWHAMLSAIFRVRLRLNPVEHLPLGDAIAAVEKCFQRAPHPDDSEMAAAVGALEVVARENLKTEWERVKRGEPAFRWAKRLGAIVFVASLALVLLGWAQWLR